MKTTMGGLMYMETIAVFMNCMIWRDVLTTGTMGMRMVLPPMRLVVTAVGELVDRH